MAATEEQKMEFFSQKVTELPVFPSVVAELLRLINNPLSSTDKIEQTLTLDSGLTIKVLRMANSAYYSVPGGVHSVKRAITVLGMETLKQLVTTSAIFDQVQGKMSSLDPVLFWKHSVYTAAVAELLSKEFSIGKPQELFICGLVHDIGMVLYSWYNPDEFNNIIKAMKSDSISYVDAEKKIFAAKHAQIGALVAKKWELSTTIQSAIRDHHTPTLATRLTHSPEVNQVVDLVYLGNRIVATWSDLENQGKDLAWLETDPVCVRLKIKPDDIKKLHSKIQNVLKTADDFLQSLQAK